MSENKVSRIFQKEGVELRNCNERNISFLVLLYQSLAVITHKELML